MFEHAESVRAERGPREYDPDDSGQPDSLYQYGRDQKRDQRDGQHHDRLIERERSEEIRH